jgi:uncharacterized alpha/beta hydrolase family protein
LGLCIGIHVEDFIPITCTLIMCLISELLLEFWTFLRPKKGLNLQKIRVTLHTRLRVRDHYISSTLIGGKGGAGPSSLHTMLDRLTEYVKSTWMPLHGIKWIMYHGHLDFFFKNPFLEVGLTQNRETMALRTLTTVDIFYFIMREDPHE